MRKTREIDTFVGGLYATKVNGEIGTGGGGGGFTDGRPSSASAHSPRSAADPCATSNPSIPFRPCAWQGRVELFGVASWSPPIALSLASSPSPCLHGIWQGLAGAPRTMFVRP